MMNDKAKMRVEAPNQLEEGELDPFLELTYSKQKLIENTKIIFDQCTSKQYDFIISKRLNRTNSAQKTAVRRDFRQIVV